MSHMEVAHENLVRVERNRGRISLGRVLPDLQPGDLFEVTVEDDGTIVLTPVQTVPIRKKKTAKRDES